MAQGQIARNKKTRTRMFSILYSMGIPQIDGFDPIYLRFKP